MNKSLMLEKRVSRLEKLLRNESHDKNELQLKAMRAVEALSKATDFVSQVAIALDYDDSTQTKEWQSLEDKLNDMITKLTKLSFIL